MLLDIVIKTLWRRKLRSILTILGVAAAIQTFMLLNSIMSYYEQDIQNQVSAFAGKIYIQRSMDATDAAEDFPSTSSSISIDKASFMLSVDGIDRNASSSVLFVVLATTFTPNMPPDVLAVGIEPGHEEAFLGGVGIGAGSADLSEPDDVILGEKAAWHYGSVINGQSLQPGDSFQIKGKNFNVTGILKTAANLYSGAVIMPLSTAQDMFNYPDTVSAVILTANNIENIDGIKTMIQENFPGLKASNQEDLEENANNMIAMQRLYFDLMSNSAILATIIVVMIVVMISVMEQRKEIGTLRAVGAGRGKIFGMIVAQSLILAMIGGLLALPVSIIINKIMGFGGVVTIVSTLMVWLTTMGLCALVGILSSLLPAWQAIHINPLEALKFE